MYTVTYVDYGLDATVYWGSIDYVFKNDTAYPIKIAAECKNGELTVKILGTKTDDISVKLRTQIIETYEPEIIEELDETIPPGDRQVVQKGITGYKVETYKTVTINGVAQPEGRISTSTYKKLDEKVKVGPPVETTASQDETTASDPVSTENPEPPAEG
jgi:vancomycin resistance protein YoaR